MTDDTDRETLTTEQVRRMIGVAPVEGLRDWKVEFDRWLAAYTAQQVARVQPTRDEIAGAVSSSREQWGESSHRIADAILALLSSTPTVAQVQAEALREAAQIVDDTARQGGGLQTAAGTLRLEADVLAPETKEDDRG